MKSIRHSKSPTAIFRLVNITRICRFASACVCVSVKSVSTISINDLHQHFFIDLNFHAFHFAPTFCSRVTSSSVPPLSLKHGRAVCSLLLPTCHFFLFAVLESAHVKCNYSFAVAHSLSVSFQFVGIFAYYEMP